MKVDGKKVRMLMMKRCTNIRRLSLDAHMGEATIRQAMNNSRKTNYRTIGKLARALRVEPAAIVKE